MSLPMFVRSRDNMLNLRDCIIVTPHIYFLEDIIGQGPDFGGKVQTCVPKLL